MKRSALVTTMGMLGAAFALVGCGKIDSSEFEGSTPTKDTVALVVPAASSTTATTGALSSAPSRSSRARSWVRRRRTTC